MSFLAKIGSAGARFLGGHASKAARFIGSNVGNIQKGARAVSSFANNSSVQRLGQQHLGIKPSIFRSVGNTASQVGNNLPGTYQAAADAVADTKRNIGQLYNAVNAK